MTLCYKVKRESAGEESVAEAAPEADESEAPTEDVAEASIEADAVDPTQQGPGDSKGNAQTRPKRLRRQQE